MNAKMAHTPPPPSNGNRVRIFRQLFFQNRIIICKKSQFPHKHCNRHCSQTSLFHNFFVILPKKRKYTLKLSHWPHHNKMFASCFILFFYSDSATVSYLFLDELFSILGFLSLFSFNFCNNLPINDNATRAYDVFFSLFILPKDGKKWHNETFNNSNVCFVWIKIEWTRRKLICAVVGGK